MLQEKTTAMSFVSGQNKVLTEFFLSHLCSFFDNMARVS